MKKLLALTALMVCIPLIAMEKDQQTFPLDTLFPELQSEVLKQVVNAPTIAQAIRNLQNIRFVNKDLYNSITTNKTVLFNALNAILQNFPESEVIIARTLNTKLAEEWLKRVNPNASFKIIPTDLAQFNIALNYITSGNLKALKNWIDKGYDFKFKQANGTTLDAAVVQSNPSIPALELIAMYNPNVFTLENIKRLLTIAYRAIGTRGQYTIEQRLNALELLEYLETKLIEQHNMSKIEANQLIRDIENEVAVYLRDLR
ncbi:hypothetical protein Noda2021_05790 [Candidatus Dependentiae bacterium Noda2021]|nr:hypothetical protein Noda2021_05790 [Candidatus Dependentiae bacterium Noda2021]